MTSLAAFAFGSISLLVQLFSKLNYDADWKNTASSLAMTMNLPSVTTYDFIVVGGGSAGCVIAGRLQENFKVLLIEAGGQPVPVTDVPFIVTEVVFETAKATPPIMNKFTSVPQNYASLHTGGVIMAPVGRMLGGTGSLNNMVFNRGSPYDFDNYARLLNDSSWSYENVMKYFKKYENFVGKLLNEGNIDNYGHDGPITTDTEVSPFLPKWFEAAEELGFKIGDPNGYQQESFAPMTKSIENGKRSSSYRKYIEPIMKIKDGNLVVHQYSTATRILIDENKKAYGVMYERHGIPQLALASKEVIISAGAFGSPLLLMKSGVGPRDQLDAAGIPVKHELPQVGENLQDHIIVPSAFFTFNTSALPYLPSMPMDDLEVVELLQKYQTTGEGLFGQLLVGPQAFIVSNRVKLEGQLEWPDLYVLLNPMCSYPQFITPDVPTSCLNVIVGRPKSRGSVALNVTAYKNGMVNDDVALAVVDFKYFEGDEGKTDVDVLLEGIQLVMAILNTTAFQSLGVALNKDSLPACAQYKPMSEEYWRCVISQTSFATSHYVGTCSMGSVVDSKFRVDGISGLRVVDASVLPVIPNANTNAAVLMIAEKAVEDIVNEWGQDVPNCQTAMNYNYIFCYFWLYLVRLCGNLVF